MKKILAIVLALVLAFAMTAFAEDATDVSSITLNKVYTLAGDGSSPAETFTFYQDGNVVITNSDATSAGNLTISSASFAEGAATAEGAKSAVTITLPTYEKVGVYTYKVKETVGNTAGVTYDTDGVTVVVTVINGENGALIRQVAVHDGTTNEKIAEGGTIADNTYSANTLKITKTVTGNLGDKTKYFEFKVTLTGETGKTYGESYAITGGSNTENATSIKVGGEATVYLKDGETVSIANLPAGVSYTVSEAAVEGYTTTSTGESGTISATAASTAAFTNDKTSTVDTGITMDTIPYVVLMALAVVGITVLAMKKRREA